MLGIISFTKRLGSLTSQILTSPQEFVWLGTGLISRAASKKAGSSARNKPTNLRPKHRRIHYQDGCFVQRGTLVVTQRTLRYHPGLNVGIGINGSLVALTPGRVVVTCEKFDPKEDHFWVEKGYAGRQTDTIYKKYFHVIPEEEHGRFKRID